MPAVSYGTGGCTTCRAGVPVPPPATAPQTTVTAAALYAQAKRLGLPWWVWVLGILALASAFRGRR